MQLRQLLKKVTKLQCAEGGAWMLEQSQITSFLEENPSFTTKDFIGMVKESQAAYSDRKAYHILQNLQNEGQIMKIGRGHYSKVSVKMPYHFKASSLMAEMTGMIDKEYPLITLQTWELYQWNEFVNHQLAHNAYFIEVESALETTVFEMLLEKYPRVLLNPGEEEYYRYRADDMIIVQKLVSGAPAPLQGTKQASLEKLLVDIFSRKLTGQLIERAEYRQIYEDAFGKYAINESALFRYAGRRHLEPDIRKFIADETSIELRSGEWT